MKSTDDMRAAIDTAAQSDLSRVAMLDLCSAWTRLRVHGLPSVEHRSCGPNDSGGTIRR